ncbi:ATP-dependent zinc protease family protein [Kaarinaea lacus]
MVKTRIIRPVMRCLVILLCFVAAAPLIAREKQIIGWIENVTITNHNIILAAKIDTGAKHSSLNAPDLHLYSKKGESRVKFSLVSADGKKIEFDERVVRMAKIKRKGYRSQIRPVVLMKVCLADVIKEVEVNLVDRENFIYPMLVGRSYLRGGFIVDVSNKHMTEPQCSKSPDRGAVAVPQ